MLFYLKSKRDASKILEVQQRETFNKINELRELKKLVNPICEIFSDGIDLNRFGELLHEGWEIKKNLTKEISSKAIDLHYQKAKKSGAVGGKLLGAGGGGFFLFYVPQKSHKNFIKNFKNLAHIPFNFSNEGSKIMFKNRD